MSKGVTSSGVKEPPSIGEGDFKTLDRLKVNQEHRVGSDVVCDSFVYNCHSIVYLKSHHSRPRTAGGGEREIL